MKTNKTKNNVLEQRVAVLEKQLNDLLNYKWSQCGADGVSEEYTFGKAINNKRKSKCNQNLNNHYTMP